MLNFPIDVKTLDYANENDIEYTPISEFPELNENRIENFKINPQPIEINLESNDYSTDDMDELMNLEENNSEEFINDLFNDDISKLINDENKK